jgi:hypothetical protein
MAHGGSEFNSNWASERLRPRLVLFHAELLRRVYRKRAIRLAYWLTLRSFMRTIFRYPDALSPSLDLVETTGASCSAPELQQLLKNDVLGV